MIPFPYFRVADYRSYCLLRTRPMILLQEAHCIHDTVRRVVGLSPALRNFTGEKSTTEPACLANVKDKFDNCGSFKGETVRVLSYSLSYGTRKV